MKFVNIVILKIFTKYPSFCLFNKYINVIKKKYDDDIN